MSSHTPGPWYARQVHADGFITHVVSLDADPVDDEYHYGRNIAKDLSGNHAAMIAAAPDLLDALERLVHLAECHTWPGPNTMAQVQAALAKARGEK